MIVPYRKKPQAPKTAFAERRVRPTPTPTPTLRGKTVDIEQRFIENLGRLVEYTHLHPHLPEIAGGLLNVFVDLKRLRLSSMPVEGKQ